MGNFEKRKMEVEKKMKAIEPEWPILIKNEI
jgi:hypothetical protein